MSVSGIPLTLVASYVSAGASAGASVAGMTGAAERGSVGPAAVLQLSNALRAPIIPTISELLRQELRPKLDLTA